MPAFMDGPMGGQAFFDPASDEPAPEQAMMPAQESEPQDEEAMFQQLLAAARALIGSDGLSEQNRLKLEKVTTLIQEIKAAEEKEMEQAATGKLSPRLISKAYGGR